jgi:hypothetical protein
MITIIARINKDLIVWKNWKNWNRKEKIPSYIAYLTGKLRIKIGPRYYYLVQPDHQVRVLAAIEYENCLYSLRFEPWLTKKSMLEILVNRGIISSTVDHQLFSLHKRLEDLKVDLYSSTFNTSNDKKIRHDIKLVREKARELENPLKIVYII